MTAKTTRKRKHVWEDWSDWLRKKIDERPDIYLRELQADLKAELGVQVSQWTLCKALGRRRNKLWELCGTVLDEFTPAECLNYFKHCGYRYT